MYLWNYNRYLTGQFSKIYFISTSYLNRKTNTINFLSSVEFTAILVYQPIIVTSIINLLIRSKIWIFAPLHFFWELHFNPALFEVLVNQSHLCSVKPNICFLFINKGLHVLYDAVFLWFESTPVHHYVFIPWALAFNWECIANNNFWNMFMFIAGSYNPVVSLLAQTYVYFFGNIFSYCSRSLSEGTI